MKLLVIRTSAMGDVALTVPAIAGMRKQYPEAHIVLVTQKTYQPFFISIPGLDFFFTDFKGRHKGIYGLLNLYRDLRRTVNPDSIIDLHDVLRSKIIRTLFGFSGIPVHVIDKGRAEKTALITGLKKIFLKHSVQRYCDVFAQAGYQVEPERNVSIVPRQEDYALAATYLDGGAVLNIGVAPFAKHSLKMWPEDYMISLLRLISDHRKCRFFLFAGKEDAERVSFFEEKVPGIVSVSGKMNLSGELALISRLDLMISMDSSNMHMAALCGTKVISIWGGTDPMAGFGAWMQPDSYSIRIPVEELDCRPCTIYGKGSSRRDFQCMKRLTPEYVFKRMMALGVFQIP